jgi:hypothetical protein
MRYLALLVLTLPSLSHAAITINEVAWMGSDTSANHEWIELYNDGNTTIDVLGWTLSDNTNLSIPLSGDIPPGTFAVLERSSDASAPGSAFLIYTGAIINTGSTLSLRRSDGSLEDQVAGGENWENIGGDNTTKETAQYTTSGWVTGVPTPGQANVTGSSPSVTSTNAEADNGDTESDSSVPQTAARPASSSSNQPTYLMLPDITLDLEVNAPTLAYVNQPVAFTAEASGIGDTLIN